MEYKEEDIKEAYPTVRDSRNPSLAKKQPVGVVYRSAIH